MQRIRDLNGYSEEITNHYDEREPNKFIFDRLLGLDQSIEVGAGLSVLSPFGIRLIDITGNTFTKPFRFTLSAPEGLGHSFYWEEFNITFYQEILDGVEQSANAEKSWVQFANITTMAQWQQIKKAFLKMSSTNGQNFSYFCQIYIDPEPNQPIEEYFKTWYVNVFAGSVSQIVNDFIINAVPTNNISSEAFFVTSNDLTSSLMKISGVSSGIDSSTFMYPNTQTSRLRLFSQSAPYAVTNVASALGMLYQGNWSNIVSTSVTSSSGYHALRGFYPRTINSGAENLNVFNQETVGIENPVTGPYSLTINSAGVNSVLPPEFATSSIPYAQSINITGDKTTVNAAIKDIKIRTYKALDSYTYSLVNEFPTSDPDAIRDLIKGNNKYLISTTGSLRSSPDLSNWTQHTMGPQLSTNGSEITGGWSANDIFYTTSNKNIVASGTAPLSAPNVLTRDLTREYRLESTSGKGIICNKMIFVNGMYLIVGNGVFTSTDSVTWIEQESSLLSPLLFDVVWSGTEFVAVGQAGHIIRSNDGINWSGIQTPAGASLHGVTWSGSLYAVVGTSGTIITSPDGVTWTLRAGGLTGEWLRKVSWGNDLFVVVGGNGTIITSPDGITWSIKYSSTNFGSSDIAYGSGVFVKLSVNSGAFSSVDGQNWTSRNVGTSTQLTSIIFAAGQFVAVGNLGVITTSPNGINWTVRTSGTTNNFVSVTHANGSFVAFTSNGVIFTSANGVTWTPLTFTSTQRPNTEPSHNNLVDIVHNGSHYVAVGSGNNTILRSSDGNTWETTFDEFSRSFYGATWGGSQFVAVGNSGSIYTSADGSSWTLRRTGSNNLWSVTWSGSQYVAVGNFAFSSLTILRSTNGTSWSSASVSGTTNLYGVTWGNNLFVAVGQNGAIRRSTDAVSWPFSASPTANNLWSVTWGNNLFVAVGDTGTIITSPDGVTWTARTSGTTQKLNKVIWANNQFVAVGESGTIITSPDSITWTARTSGTSVGLNSIVFADNKFTALGDTVSSRGTYFTSSNGIDWVQTITLPLLPVVPRVLVQGSSNAVLAGNDGFISYNAGTNYSSWTAVASSNTSRINHGVWANNQFLLVGENGTIITSPNGITWTARTSGTSASLTKVIWDGQKYLVITQTSSIITSPDGVTWSSVTPGIRTISSLAYTGTLYLAVTNESTGSNYVSTNAVDWNLYELAYLTSQSFLDLLYHNNEFVAVTDDQIVKSANGNVWELVNAPGVNAAGAAFRNISRHNQKYIVTDSSGNYTSSNDGTSWTSRWPLFFTSSDSKLVYSDSLDLYISYRADRDRFGTSNGSIWDITDAVPDANYIIWANNQFVAVGNSGAIHTSTDGITWTARTSGTTRSLVKVEYANNLYVAIGALGTVLTSVDGISWTARTSGTSASLTNIKWMHNRFVAAGSTVITTSADGITWVAATATTSRPWEMFYWTNGSGSQYDKPVYIVGALYSYDLVTWRTIINSSLPSTGITYVSDEEIIYATDQADTSIYRITGITTSIPTYQQNYRVLLTRNAGSTVDVDSTVFYFNVA